MSTDEPGNRRAPEGAPDSAANYLPTPASAAAVSPAEPVPPSVGIGAPIYRTALSDITERTRLEEVQDFLARTSSGSANEPFFNALARYLAQSLSMDFVCIDRLEGEGLTAQTLAVWCDGHFQDNVRYALKDTPCGEVVGKRVCCFPASVGQFFPRDQVLQELRAESYVGATLWSHTGQPIGLIAVIGRTPMANRSLAEAMLRLVAGRAAGELERLDAEVALRKSEERYALTLAAVNDGLWDWHIPSGTAFFTPLYYAILGYENNEFPATYDFWRLLVHPEDIDRVERELLRSIGTGKGFTIDLRMRKKTGEWLWVSTRGKTMEMDAEGKALRMVGVLSDITERKRAEAEKEKLEAQNRQLQKSESLGRMAGAIAHHFNNQLQAVMLNLEMARNDLPRGAGPMENLTHAMQSARKAGEVSSLMLTYLGQTVSKREPMDLSEACLRSLPLLRAGIQNEVVLETELLTPGPAISANANQLQQVLTNLVTNAWEAMGDGHGAVHLSVKTISAADIPARNRFPIDWQPQDNAYACLGVADAGCGIADTDIEKLFDPFFSSKFTGRGLGLPVVLGIVRAHNGVITVESKRGRGSVFRVFFPVSAEPVPQKPVQRAQNLKMAGGGTVLVVEDEPSVRKSVTLALTRLGFTVLAAEDGVEAVEIFREHQDEIRLVLCDLTMPRMNGWETLTALRQIAPGVPVILSSGYSEAQVMDGNHPELPQAVLSKPYEFKALADAIRQILTSV